MVAVALFTAEYLLRVLVADRKLSFVFSFFGPIDLRAILPFYIATGVDLRAIRAFFGLCGYSARSKLCRIATRFRDTTGRFLIAREEIVLFVIVAVLMIYFAAVGIYYFESEAQPDKFAPVFHSLWWSIATLTTVGYGDVYPITTGGKIFAAVVLVVGLGIVAVPAGLLASALSKAREIDD